MRNQKKILDPLSFGAPGEFSKPAGRVPLLAGSRRGFTLMEVIVVIVILSIVSSITILFLVNSLKICAMTVNEKTLLDEGKLALERICRDIRDARAILTPAAGGSGSILTFTRSHGTAQDNAGESITFQLNGSTLEKVKLPAHRAGLPGNVDMITGSALTPRLGSVTALPAYKAGHPADLPVKLTASSRAMASNVSEFMVTRAATHEEIKIQITLSLGSGEEVSLRTKVYPKNLGDDLTSTYKNFFDNWREDLSR